MRCLPPGSTLRRVPSLRRLPCVAVPVAPRLGIWDPAATTVGVAAATVAAADTTAAAKPGFFAISCAPNIQGFFEFLIKETEGSAWFTGVVPGDQVLMSPVGGKGFPMSRLDPIQFPAVPEEEAVKDILLFATGSGIAPIRAAIESQLNGLRAPSRRSIKLYYGARYPARMAYMDRFPLWASDKVEVIPVMSRPTEAADEWTGRTGYIQQALMQDGVAAPRQTGVLMCGVGGMTKDVKAFLTEQGVPEDRILTNF